MARVSRANGKGEVRLFTALDGAQQDSDAFVVIADRAGTTVLFPLAIALGDFDGDGVTDLAVSRVTPAGDGVFVFAGGTRITGNLDVTDADYSFAGAAPGAVFGASLSAADAVGDGADDLLVGEPLPGSAGRAVLIEGGAGFGGTPTLRIVSGTTTDDDFGSAVGLGDHDGNGEVDLVVAAGATAVKEVYVFLQSSGVFSSVPDVTYSAEGLLADFAQTLAVGELTGDQFAEVVVGAPFHDFVNTDEGRVWVFNGSATPVSRSAIAADGSIRGVIQNDLVGAALVIGDVNADGQDDLLVSAPRPGDGSFGSFGSRVAIYLGGVAIGTAGFGNSRDIIDAETSQDAFGRSLLLYDTNGDGRDDLIVGAPEHDTNVNQGGTIYVFRGAPSFVPADFDAADATIDGRRNGFSLGD